MSERPCTNHRALLAPQIGNVRLVSASGPTGRFLLTAVLLLGAASLVASASARRDPPPTQLIVYAPFTSNGALAHGVKMTAQASGHCWTGSETDPRSDAWRCFRGNEILDPCFSDANHAKWVACPVGAAFGTDVLRLKLTEPLPLAMANRTAEPTKDDPTDIRLTSGVSCAFAGGATGTVGGMRFNYDCPGGHWLVGDPHRDSATWTILYAANLTSKQLTTVEIATVYW